MSTAVVKSTAQRQPVSSRGSWRSSIPQVVALPMTVAMSIRMRERSPGEPRPVGNRSMPASSRSIATTTRNACTLPPMIVKRVGG
ncbi:hypothetical protein [Actinoplanes sp. NPDC051411]|uniref:hypothetical protein n=1 Tax=Actinoplanes sp. NPDC051411 TaxID=3155522 RepID=UPI00343AC346